VFVFIVSIRKSKRTVVYGTVRGDCHVTSCFVRAVKYVARKSDSIPYSLTGNRKHKNPLVTVPVVNPYSSSFCSFT